MKASLDQASQHVALNGFDASVAHRPVCASGRDLLAAAAARCLTDRPTARDTQFSNF